MAGEQQGAQTLEKSRREVRLCKSVRTAVAYTVRAYSANETAACFPFQKTAPAALRKASGRPQTCRQPREMVTGPGQRSQDLGQWCKEDVAESGIPKWGRVSCREEDNEGSWL